jgi:hypothetical protein
VCSLNFSAFFFNKTSTEHSRFVLCWVVPSSDVC